MVQQAPDQNLLVLQGGHHKAGRDLIGAGRASQIMEIQIGDG